MPGRLSFFLFIILTVTGIFLMFFYRPTAVQAWDDIYAPPDSVTSGLLAQHAQMGRPPDGDLGVPAHGAPLPRRHKAPWEFNWVIGVVLLTLTPAAVVHRLPAAWDQLGPLWAVTVGTNMIGWHAGVRKTRCASCCSAALRSAPTRCCDGTLHVLFFLFITVIFMAIHFWRVRKDGGISGPL